MKNVVWYKQFLLAVLFFTVFFAVGCSLPYLAHLKVEDLLGDITTPSVEKGEPVNILCLGIDARPGEKNTRTDTMLLAHVDPGKKKVVLISIPRDTRIDIPGSGVDKINAANAVGGPKAAVRAVERLMGLDVDYYILANFQGFAKVVDILGGVTIEVEKRMYKPSEDINLYPGVQRLNGRKALAYVRWRGDALGDIGRTERQQKFAMAMAKELYQTKTIAKLPALLPELAKYVETDMGLRQMLALAKVAGEFTPNDLICQTLPGYFYNDPQNGLSYWIADKTKVKTLINDLLAGRKVAVVEEGPGVSPLSNAKGRKVKPVAQKAGGEVQSDASADGEVSPEMEEPLSDTGMGSGDLPSGPNGLPDSEPTSPAENLPPGSGLPENSTAAEQQLQNKPFTPSSPVSSRQPTG